MFLALNMELNIVRTVLTNDINDIYVCMDNKGNNGTFYTLISVKDKEIKKQIVELMTDSGSFSDCPDFVGTFMNFNTYNLVFKYKNENVLAGKDVLYVRDFKDRKTISISFLAACAEIKLEGKSLELILNERNVNITEARTIYFNYFIDFSSLKSTTGNGVKAVSEYIFKFLSVEYEKKYSGNVLDYPDELNLFYKKIMGNSFSTYSKLIAFIRSLSDNPVTAKGLWLKIINLFEKIKAYLAKNSLKFFVTVLVIVTVIYAGYQIIIRLSVYEANKEKTVYDGVDYIGEVYLGDIEE